MSERGRCVTQKTGEHHSDEQAHTVAQHKHRSPIFQWFDTPFRDTGFDAIHRLERIEHYAETTLAIEEMARVNRRARHRRRAEPIRPISAALFVARRSDFTRTSKGKLLTSR